MHVQVIPLAITVVYLVGMLLIGYLVGKLQIKNSTDYMIAGRRMGLFMVACSLSANNVGGGSTTGLAARAYSGWGMSAAWYVLAAAIAMIPLSYFAPIIRKTMAVSIPEVLGRRYGSATSTITAVLNIASLFCLTSSQVMASGSAVASLMGIALLNISLVTMNLFAFALRAAGPFAAYALGLACPGATRHAGISSIVVGSVAAIVWQVLGEPLGILAIVFGCAMGTLAFLITWAIEKAMGAPPAPVAAIIGP